MTFKVGGRVENSTNKDEVEKDMQPKSKETVVAVFSWDLLGFMVIFLLDCV